MAIRTILPSGAALRAWMIAALAAPICLIAAVPAQAAPTTSFTVDFNSLSNGATNAQIGALLTQAFHAAGLTSETVTVSGAIGSNSYTGDGHVVGPVNGSKVTSDTLAQYDAAYNGTKGIGTFIQNDSAGGSNAIVMTFSAPINLSNISFDYEIFPNGDCQSSTCGKSNWPTINVTDTYNPNVSSNKTGSISNGSKTMNVTSAAGLNVGDIITGPGIPAGTTISKIVGTKITMSKNATHTYASNSFAFTEPNVTSQIFERYANVPGLATNTGQILTTPVAPCPSSTRNCGGTTTPPSASMYLHSPNSGPSKNEAAPQLLGSSGIVALNVPAGGSTTTLTFNDWPATIAINHITFNVPEPGSLILLGSSLLALGMLRRRKRA